MMSHFIAVRKHLCQIFASTDVALVNTALEACAFDVELAQEFLLAMTPQDSDKYFVRTLPDKCTPTVRILTSRLVQTNENFQDFFGTPMLREQIDEQHEKPYRYWLKFIWILYCNHWILLRNDKSTWTKEDRVIVKTVHKLAQGPIGAKGPAPRDKRFVQVNGEKIITVSKNIILGSKYWNFSYYSLACLSMQFNIHWIYIIH